MLAQTQGRQTPSQPVHSALLPLSEIPQIVPAGQDDVSADVFGNFRRFGLTYLDENGEELEFSAGVVLDGERGRQTQDGETEAFVSGCSESESDVAVESDPQPKRFACDVDSRRDYWPYPSKTVSKIGKY